MPRGRPKKQLEMPVEPDPVAKSDKPKKKSSLRKELDDLWQKLNKLNDMRFCPLMDQLNQAKDLCD